MRFFKALPIVVSLVALLGCDRAAVSGRVTNVRGEALPGVAVMFENTDSGVLTNGLGWYRVPQQPGEVVLTFSKTGYAPRRIQINAARPGRTENPVLELWTLPTSAGVFVFEKGVYLPTTWPEPRRYFLGESETVYGTVRNPEVVTGERWPLLVCYKMPRDGARLSRLELGKGRVRSGDAQTLDVWLAAGTRPVDLSSIEETEGRLFRVKIDEALEPGVYALHWQALGGRFTIEKRIFLFEVAAENVGQVAPPPENR